MSRRGFDRFLLKATRAEKARRKREAASRRDEALTFWGIPAKWPLWKRELTFACMGSPEAPRPPRARVVALAQAVQASAYSVAQAELRHAAAQRRTRVA